MAKYHPKSMKQCSRIIWKRQLFKWYWISYIKEILEHYSEIKVSSNSLPYVCSILHNFWKLIMDNSLKTKIMKVVSVGKKIKTVMSSYVVLPTINTNHNNKQKINEMDTH